LDVFAVALERVYDCEQIKLIVIGANCGVTGSIDQAPGIQQCLDAGLFVRTAPTRA